MAVQNNSAKNQQPAPGKVVITINLSDVSVYDKPWTLDDIAKAVQQDYFNYPGATSDAAIYESNGVADGFDVQLVEDGNEHRLVVTGKGRNHGDYDAEKRIARCIFDGMTALMEVYSGEDSKRSRKVKQPPKPDNWKTSPCAAGKHDRCGIYGSREDCTCECHVAELPEAK